jgi:predicted Zn-dependent protease
MQSHPTRIPRSLHPSLARPTPPPRDLRSPPANSKRTRTLHGLASVFLLGVWSYRTAEAAPPPGAVAAPHARRLASAGTGTSLGDSALEPAAVDAARSGDWARAESLYRELVRRQPRNAAAKHSLGIALLRLEKPDAAVAVLEESVSLADDARTRLDLASALAATGRYASALPHLRKAVRLASREPAGWTQLAAVLVKLEKPDGAADVLRDSARACPSCSSDEGWNRVTDDIARSFSTKVEKQLASNDVPGAKKSLDLAVALRPNLPETHLAMGKVARAEGDKKGAATALRRAVDGLPDAHAESGATARLELATLLLSEGGGAESARLAEQVVAARGDNAVALDTLGRACDATRDASCARRAYGRLVKLPSDAASKGALAHARLRMKELKSRRR